MGFWIGMWCLPVSLVLFVIAFRAREVGKAMALFLIGGSTSVFFLLFLDRFAGAWGPASNDVAPWWRFLLMGVCVAGPLAAFRALIGLIRASRLSLKRTEEDSDT